MFAFVKLALIAFFLNCALGSKAGNQSTMLSQICADDSLRARLALYLPSKEKNIGIGMVVCPGGSYAFVSDHNEGTPIGKWLAENGVTALVLNYRLPQGEFQRTLKDAFDAIRLLKTNASALGIKTDKVGIWGSSAGGHLAATVSTHFMDSLSYPHFTILYYPVISSRKDLIHQRSFRNLLGDKAGTDRFADFSAELCVTSSTPPALLLLSDDDSTVNPLNSIVYYEALKRYAIPASIYVFPVGKHGYGMTESCPYLNLSKELVLDWLVKIIK